jgi:hypothetical protein
MQDEFKEQGKEFFNAIKDFDALMFVVLKGHLLIEEEINKILEAKLFHPKYIKETKFDVFQKILLCRALCPKANESIHWRLIISLNQLRNKVAHKLSSSERKRDLDEIKKIMYEVAQASSISLKGRDDYYIIESAFAVTHGFLIAFRKESILPLTQIKLH